MRAFWDGLATVIARRFRLVLVLALLATAGLAVGIPLLDFETSQVSLIGEENPVAQDNERFQDEFGGEPMIVLLTAQEGHDVLDLFDEENLPRLQAFDQSLRDTGLFHAVLSPLVALEFARNQMTVGNGLFEAASVREQQRAREEAAAAGAGPDEQEAAAAEVAAAFTERLLALAGRLEAAEPGITARALTDPASISNNDELLENRDLLEVLLYEDENESIVRPVLRDNFLDRTHAVTIARLNGNVDIADMGAAADAVQDAVREAGFEGFDVLATGPPELLQDINDYLQGGMATLGGLSFLVMIVVLWFVFRVRWRLLSMVIVILGAIWGFGIMGYIGLPLTLITISGLPILIGIGVDFSIQAHSRFEEEIDHDGDAESAVRRVMRWLTPALAVAMIAAVAGFLALQVSEVPLIRDFGVMLALGIFALFVAGITVPTSILVWRERRHPTPAGAASVPHGVLERIVRWMCFSARTFILPVVLAGLGVIFVGLALEGRFTIQTDPEEWIPQDGRTVRSLEELREDTGFSSELQLLIEADDVTATPVSEWIQVFTIEQAGYANTLEAPEIEGKHEALIRGTSLPAVAMSVTGVPPGQEEVELLLGDALEEDPEYTVAPRDFVVQFMSSDLTSTALIFPITDVTLGEREELVDEMLADLELPPGFDAEVGLTGPPEGVSVLPAGLVYVGVELVDALEANRALMTWLALGAVALWLLIRYRRIVTTLLPLVPVTIAVGLSSLVIFATGIELSPLTSVTGPLVIATCTEFSVLILARYVEERERGRDPDDAVAHGAVRIGRAFVASGLTTVGGFGVMAFSAFPLLRDFGIVVALNVLVALVSALVVLPPLLMWADRTPWLKTFSPGERPGMLAGADEVAPARTGGPSPG